MKLEDGPRPEVHVPGSCFCSTACPHLSPPHAWDPERNEAAKGLLFGVKEATGMHGVICIP